MHPILDERKRRGRRAIHHQALTPDGLTKEQQEIIRVLAGEAGISIASFKRQMTRDFLLQFGYSNTEQGLTNDG